MIEAPNATAEDVVSALRASACDVLLQVPSVETLRGTLERAGLITRNGVPLQVVLTSDRVNEVPSVAGLAPRLEEIERQLRDAKATFTSIAEIIGRDPGLAARVLRTANSPLWFGSRLDSIEKACVRLGTVQVGHIAKQELLGQIYQLNDPVLRDLGRAMWGNALATAACARALAPLIGVEPSDAYNTALFHNIGEIVALAGIAHHPVLERTTPGFRNLVIDAYIQHHAAMGGNALRRIGASAATVTVAEHHAGPIDLRLRDPHSRLQALTVLSWELAIEAGFSYPRREHRFSIEAIGRALRLDRESLRAHAAKAFAHCHHLT